jgi:2,3-bisphosphoglycerate-dependent phosphoglycerate mutase
MHSSSIKDAAGLFQINAEVRYTECIMADLVLVRHGESYHNKMGIICGDLESPLTAIGRKQAQALALQLTRFSFSNAFTSPLSRARDTLDLIAQKQEPQPAVEIVPNLLERHLGSITGEAESDYSEDQWRLWTQWESAPPQGESYADMNRRLIPWFEGRVRSLFEVDQDILIVAHRAVIKILRQHLENYPIDLVGDLTVPNCGIVHYIIKDGIATLKAADTFPVSVRGGE